MSLKFFNLHGHSGFSLYDGYGSINEHVEWMLKNAGEDSGGLTISDHGTINSAGYFAAAQKKYKDKGAKLLWATESYYIPSLDEWAKLKQDRDEQKKQEKEEGKKKKKVNEDSDEEEGLVFENEKESKSKYFDPINRRNHLVLVAYNQQGLKNLFRLVTRSHREGFYRKPRIDFKMLKDCSEGLIASTACVAGIPSFHSLQASTMEEAHQRYDQELMPLMELFGKDRFFLELQFNKLPEQQVVNRHLVEYAKKTGYKLIATADSHFPSPSDWKARELYRMLGFQMKKQEIDRSILDKTPDDLEAHLYLKNGNQLFQSYKETEFYCKEEEGLIKEAIERTYDIAHHMCEHVYPDDKIKLPKPSKIQENKTSFDTLKSLCVESLKKRGLYSNKQYFDRLILELKIINKLNLADYFLVLKEGLDVLKEHMLINDGRGSGAGSLVNYLLDITLLDPLENELLFERFLSSTKAEADIDNDLELREEALDILKQHFGQDNVLTIANYNKLQLKSIVKDLSKLHGIEFSEVNAVTSVMEKEAKDKILEEINHDQKLYEFTFEKAVKYSPTFKQFVNNHPEVAEHVEALYQEIKSTGTHAGGIILVPNAEECLPVIKSGGIDQSPITEGITAQHLKYFGLIKYDFLGLSTLKIIRRCIESILKKEGNKNPTIKDVWKFYNEKLKAGIINPKDQRVFDSVYRVGKFPSIFQFEQPNVQAFCTKAKPESVFDIAVITSLWRPGPLGGGADKKYLFYDESKVKKEHPIVQKILGKTRGLLVFQEQFMQLAHELADLTLEESDQLRKILVKPSHELGEELKKKRQEYREKFITGCINKGLSEKRAIALWDEEIIGFVSYGFNKSHAISYAYTSYRCAWLYTYYPTEWIKACLECDPEPQKIINTVRGLGYNVSKVDVNYSAVSEWSYVNDSWLPPLTSLKGVGDIGACELFNQRPEGGFKDLSDFFINQYGNWRWSKLNKKCLEALFKVESFGSLKCVGNDKVFKNYKHLHDFISENIDKIKKGKVKFEDAALNEVQDWTSSEKILFQKDIVGFYDKGLIINKFTKTFEEFNIQAVDEEEEPGPRPKVWGIVENIEQKSTKNNKLYYNISVSGISNASIKFKAWIKPDEANDWAIGNVLVFGLDYSPEWGFSLSRKTKVLKVTR